MSQGSGKQIYFKENRRSWRRQVANMPPSKKVELALFGALGVTALILAAYFVS